MFGSNLSLLNEYVHQNISEGLNKFCSHHIFVLATRFTLAFNLVQLPVMVYWLSAARSPIPFSIFSLVSCAR
jgi:hypothetical protein